MDLSQRTEVDTTPSKSLYVEQALEMPTGELVQVRFMRPELRRKVGDEVKARFLDFLAVNGQRYTSAKLAGTSMAVLKRELEEDEEFAVAVEEAEGLYADSIAEAVRERAVEGYEEPVFYKGAACGSVRRFSDRMLELEAKRREPGYRDQRAVDVKVSGGVLVAPGIAPSGEDWERAHGAAARGPSDPRGAVIEGVAREVLDSDGGEPSRE